MANNPMRGALRVYSQVEDYGRHRMVGIFSQRADGSEWMAKPLEFVDVTNRLLGRDEYTVGPAMGTEVLQAMLDHAWLIGMRPAGFSDVPLQTEALKAHLADMRALVFRQPPPTSLGTDELRAALKGDE